MFTKLDEDDSDEVSQEELKKIFKKLFMIPLEGERRDIE